MGIFVLAARWGEWLQEMKEWGAALAVAVMQVDGLRLRFDQWLDAR